VYRLRRRRKDGTASTLPQGRTQEHRLKSLSPYALGRVSLVGWGQWDTPVFRVVEIRAEGM
jgi:hypothetical protein